MLLTLMVVLTATALAYRTFTRSDMAISQREQVRVANVAAPAVDRARAKIEFLFNNDPRLTGGLPTSDFLASMMLDEPYITDLSALPGDPFTLPDEERLDINGDNTLDNAWRFDDNGETIVYSILVDDIGPKDISPDSAEAIRIQDPVNEDKAQALVTRTGPVAATAASPACVNARSEAGWQVVDQGSSASLQKNFQINVFVPNESDANSTVESFEFQQSRIADRGNKWAAWFRYDLEAYPGSPFTINGAMHTDGNLILGGFQNNSSFESYKISSHNSCVYGREASEVTVGVGRNNDDFQGQIVKGTVVQDSYGGQGPVTIHVWDGDNQEPVTNRQLTDNNDSVRNGSPGDVASNPLVLFTADRLESNNAATWQRDAAWLNNPIHAGERDGASRVLNKRVPKPFVDDLFRADNRWGPKPRYDETDTSLDITQNARDLGDEISTTGFEKLRDPVEGLDGYWERQAIAHGLRLVVGERLELGNPVEWNLDPSVGEVAENADRLYPPSAERTVGNKIGANEYRQKRSLRDNLAAVQSMAVYHFEGGGMASDGEFPMACYALTAHPGTRKSIANSRTFGQWLSGGPRTDFFNGQGTNGWEFKYHDDFDKASEFATQVAANQPLGKALRNLAHFAGDPNGGAPSFPAVQDSLVHPYPQQAMWGDFSNLRRIIDAGGLNSDSAFNDLSPADKSTVHTAACTLGVLAYNMGKELQDFKILMSDPPPPGFPNLQSISQRFNNLIGRIALYIANDTPPGPQYSGLVQELTGLGLDRNSWINRRIVPIVRNERAKRDPVTGDLVTTANGNLIILGDSGEDLIDGIPLETERDPVTNQEVVVEMDNDPYAGNAATLTYLRTKADQYLRENQRNRFLGNLKDASGNDIADTQGRSPGGASEYFNQVEFEQWKKILPYGTGNLNEDNARLFEDYANRVNRIYALIRDRDLGFKEGQTAKTFEEGGRELDWDADTGYLVTVDYGTGNIPISLRTNCDPNVFRPILAGGGGGDDNVGVSGLVGCSQRSNMPVKFPSLYYLFPLEEHDHDGADYHAQPQEEEYISQDYIRDENSDFDFEIVTKSEANDTAIIEGVKEIAAVPKAVNLSDWVLPVTGDRPRLPAEPTHAQINAAPFRINLPGTTAAADVAFLDKGMFDGREQMAIRVLDMDMATLTSEEPNGATTPWIPDIQCDPDDLDGPDCNTFSEGIVYAFREDAVREDEIVRPKRANQDADDCLTVAAITTANCRMRTTPDDEQDPPLTEWGVSLKPVDFVADPDRRPHGFRFRNGADMSAGRTRDVGMTFVTDNSAYVQGDFNRHFGRVRHINNAGTQVTAGADSIMEEFRATVMDKVWTEANFYTARTEQGDGGLNLNFARPETDTWRPVEILADAFTILSGSLIDGAAEDTFTIARPGNTQPTNTSYMNQSRPDDDLTGDGLVRENGVGSPVWINRNGDAFIDDGPVSEEVAAGDWTGLRDSDGNRRSNLHRIDEDDVRVNAVFIGGIVPSRPEQAYGGLHNFPRLIEHWREGGNQRPLIISGAFLQLNFATASTGPFEHDAWEPGASPDNSERLGYYFPPLRRWGYDPGLLYYPPAAAARRFISVGTPRNEYFRELPANDPYINLLRCAREEGEFIFDPPIRGDSCPTSN
ncbi:hypothetical protein E1H13_25140 [Nodosilinea sp. P-1105]|nr:hypothetical protein [Nodosilinea sp. P-1105]